MIYRIHLVKNFTDLDKARQAFTALGKQLQPSTGTGDTLTPQEPPYLLLERCFHDEATGKPCEELARIGL